MENPSQLLCLLKPLQKAMIKVSDLKKIKKDPKNIIKKHIEIFVVYK